MGLDQTSFPKLWNVFQRLFGDQKLKLSAVEMMIDESDLIIDFGCATGLMYPRYMSKYDADYLGIDIDNNALEIARLDFPNAEFINAPISSLSDRLNLYQKPCIILSNVLHHMDDAAVTELFMMLAELPSHVQIVALDPEAKQKGYSLVFRAFHKIEKGDFRRSLPQVLTLMAPFKFQIEKCDEYLGRAPIWPFGPTMRGWGLRLSTTNVSCL